MNFIKVNEYKTEKHVNLDLIKVINIEELAIEPEEIYYLVVGYFDYDDIVMREELIERNGGRPLPYYNESDYKKVTLFVADIGTPEENLAAAKRFVQNITSKK